MKGRQSVATRIALTGIAAGGMLALVASGAPQEAGETTRAVQVGPMARAEIRPLGAGDVTGTLTFEQQGDLVRISGGVRGLSPGKHGFHVHAGTSCEERGGHFDPDGSPHGSPDARQRHVGDLGNLAAGPSGEVAYLRFDREVSLSGAHSVVGHVLVIHQGEDDYLSQPSGNAGTQIACGRIVLESGAGAAQGSATSEVHATIGE